jgi:TDG/mug DNA glycosylase family protein
MDHRTVEIYQRGAADYAEQRRAEDPARAERFAAAVPEGALRLDLGCGPGFYLPWLGSPVVAADAAVAMVGEARRLYGTADAGGPHGVACDLEALPFRTGAFGGVWSSKTLQHVPTERLPMALADLYRVTRVGSVLDLTMFAGPSDDSDTVVSGEDFADQDFPGRLFARWNPDDLRRVLIGAGFEVESLQTGGGRRMNLITITARRLRTLPDTVGPGMRLLVCGLNPSLYAADAGVGFARPGNRFWPAALAAGLVSVTRDPQAALHRDRIGMTDLAKRATVAASELTSEEYRRGLERVEHLVRWLQPRAVCFVGLAGWRAAVDRRAETGIQPRRLADVPVYVMPSTSGLNARVSLDQLTEHLRAAAWLADRSPSA